MRSLAQPQQHVVEYGLQRRARLADYQAGLVAREEICDADRFLLLAAKFHGQASTTLCPVCAKERLTHVSWVFGDSLGPASGSARGEHELAQLSLARGEFTVHVVEVCRGCSWNFLVRSYVTGVPKARAKGKRGASR